MNIRKNLPSYLIGAFVGVILAMANISMSDWRWWAAIVAVGIYGGVMAARPEK